MRYFASVDDKERPVRKKVASSGSGMSEVEEQILGKDSKYTYSIHEYDLLI